MSKLILVSKRPEYGIKITINGRKLNQVIIDQHYREQHGESMNDQLILDLVRELDGGNFPIEMTQGEFQYFTVEPVFRSDKPYRIILLLCVTDDYLGVVNAFRIDE
jgi:hypothetical protein